MVRLTPSDHRAGLLPAKARDCGMAYNWKQDLHKFQGQLTREQQADVDDRISLYIDSLNDGNQHLWPVCWHPGARTTGQAPLPEDTGRMHHIMHLHAARAVLSSHFPLFLIRMEEAVQAMRMGETGENHILASACFLGLSKLACSVCQHLINFRSYPEDMTKRFLTASLDLLLFACSYATLTGHDECSPNIADIRRTPTFWIFAFCLQLRYFPHLTFDLDTFTLAWHPLSGVSPADSKAFKFVRKRRKDLMLQWLSWEADAGMHQPFAAVRLCAALALPIPLDDKRFEGGSSQMWTLPDAKQRLDSVFFDKMSPMLRAMRLETCLGCGKYRKGDIEEVSFKFCGSCGFASYCSQECQMIHWRQGGHKQACNRLCKKKTLY